MKLTIFSQNRNKTSLFVLIAIVVLLLCNPIYAQTNDWTEVARSSLDWGTLTKLRHHGMAYLGNDRVLLFGGIDAGYNSETSIFDVSSDSWDWKQNLTDRPDCRVSMGMAYIGGDKVLLYGGARDGGKYDQTWIYDDSESRWIRRYPQTTPGRRSDHAMAYIGGDKVLLFGGVTRDGLNSTVSNETWIYDLSDNNWTQMNSGSVPAARYKQSMAYIGGDKVIMFGGYSYATGQETWIFDLSENNWTLKEPILKPERRYDHDMAYIGEGLVVLYGGTNAAIVVGGDIMNDTWVYNSNDNSWTEDIDEPGAPKPWARYGHGFSETSMDGSTKPVMFGGKDSVWGEHNLATWMFGGGDWLQDEGPTSITVTAPNGGETWYVGEWHNITWESDQYIGRVIIDISTNGGSSWWDVTQGSYTSNDGSFSYRPVQENISDQCMIRVTSVEAPSVSDRSNNVFTITSSGSDHPAPTDIMALNGYHQAVPLVWKAPTSETPQGYNIYRNSQKIASNITRTYYRDETVPDDQVYSYQVTAVYSDGESGFSNDFWGSAMTNGNYINAGWASSAPNLDGNINSSEWTDAASTNISIPGNSGTVRLYVMNDNDYLYVAVDDGIDNSLDNSDNFGIGFDDNHDREFPSTSPSSEGRIRIEWNYSASNRYSGIYGYFPDNLNFEGWTTPPGISQGIAQTNGHVHYEGRIDLDSSPLQSSPGNTVGIAFYIYDAASSYYTGMWPENLFDLQDYASSHRWFYAPFGWGDVKLATSSGDTPGSKKWEFLTGDEIHSSPAIGSNGTIYVGSGDNKLYAIDPNGTKKWEFEADAGIYSSPAIGSDGTIYIGCYDHKIYAVNPNGTEKWEFVTSHIVLSSPAIGSDGTIYVGSYDNILYAINPDGTEKWKYGTGGDISSSPAIGIDGTIYVGSVDNKLYAINPDHTKAWDFETGLGIHSSPAIGSDGTIYVGSGDHKLYAINPDGEKKWDFETGLGVSADPVIGSDGTVYVGSNDYKLYAVNPDGQKKWDFETGHIITSSPAIGSNGTIYVGSFDKKLYAVNPDGGKKWEFVTGSPVASSPAIGSDGTIYVGGTDHKLYAINSSSGGLADTPWPMFHQNVRHTGNIEEFENIVINGDFSNGLSGWNFKVFSPGQANGSVNSSEEFVASISNGGTEVWHVQLVQPNVLIENGKHYTVTFEAYAASPRQIRSLVTQHGNSWKYYSNYETISLTTSKQQYSYSFTMNEPTDSRARFDFNLGLSDADVYLDHIVLKETTTNDQSEITVWPGDANNDGLVSVFDINYIVAIHWNKTGPSRQNGSMQWTGQPATAWNTEAATYTDCNGDGKVNIFDVNAVIVNFGKSHGFMAGSNTVGDYQPEH